MSLKAIGLYAFLVLAVSWCLQFLVLTFWGLDHEMTMPALVAVMWSPTLIALAFIMIHPAARRGVLWRLGRLAYLPFGITVETLIGLAVVGILVAAGMASSGWFGFGGTGVAISGGPWLLGTGFQGWAIFALNILVTAIVYSLFGLIAATGEEFAWRGFLQGHLTRQCGVRRGILILAAIWWAWHLPGLLAGYNFPDYPYLGAFVLFPLQMAGASLFFGWLVIRAGSFWPAALAHGAVNSVQQGLIDNLDLGTSMLHVDLLRTALVFVVGLVCWFALRNDAREPVHPQQA